MRRTTALANMLSVLGAALLPGAVSAPFQAQVVRQLTDEKTTVSSPGALDDAGSVVFAGASADFAGENPDHAFQIVRFDPTTGDPTPLTSFPDGAAAAVSVSDDAQWIVFTSPADLTGQNHDQSSELFVMFADGTQLTQLTDDPAVNAGSVGQAAISGDGSRIAFVANTDPLGTNPDNVDQLFVINRDGTGLAQLTTAAEGSFGSISISDDGTRIAFAHSGDLTGGNLDLGSEIFAIDAGGTNLRQLTVSPDTFDSSGTSLAGNGLRVAFQSNADLTGGNMINQTEVFVIDWDGTNLSQLTTTTTVLGITGDPASASPSITDDGQTIVYHSNRSSIFPPSNVDGNYEIFRIQADGTGRAQLTGTLLDGGSLVPVVSGGGGRITYYGVGPDLTLEAMDGNGGNQRVLLAFDLVFQSGADLTPDGSRTVFVRSTGLFGGGEMWRVQADGTDLTQVTDLSSGSPSSPSISADNDTIVFSSDSNDAGTNLDGSDEIFKIQADGSGLTQLTDGPLDTASDNPVVAASASIVVFDSDADLTGGNPDLSREIFVINQDGTGLAQLTNGPLDTTSRLPRVDASGTWVVFESDADLTGGNLDGSFEVFRARTDGLGLEQLTADAMLDSHGPDISAAGDRIVFSTAADPLLNNPEGNTEVFLYRTDTAALLQLTSFAEGDSGGARLSGGGDWVYFVSDATVFEDDPDRPSDLYRVPALGGAVERVGALRADSGGGVALGGSGGALAVDDSGQVGVFAGLGNLTEANPDLLPELWVLDRNEPPVITVSKESPTVVSWTHESGPVRYDVIRGDVELLADGGAGTVDLGPVVCIEDDSPDADTMGFEDTEDPAPGQVFFYVYRGTPGLLAGPGSYGVSFDGRERLAGSGDCGS